MENSAFTALYWTLMTISSRHPILLRAGALVVAVVHFASVTWVPIVHPLIHPDKALQTPPSAVDTPTSGHEHEVMGEVLCVACMVSPNALPSPYRFLPAPESARKQPLVRQQVKWRPLHSFIPTNPARAPPSL
jgi:hypothetical protein